MSRGGIGEYVATSFTALMKAAAELFRCPLTSLRGCCEG